MIKYYDKNFNIKSIHLIKSILSFYHKTFFYGFKYNTYIQKISYQPQILALKTAVC